MVEDDTFTYHAKRQPRDYTSKAAHSLITKERMQKLDLLIHLLSNLKQALVVCGPAGIGKTTLLNALQQRSTDSWHYCLIQGNAELSFEVIQGELARDISQSRLGQIILIVDNAGELVPGLISTLIQYTAANPVLRVVFALTHDELQMKRGSDRLVDDCHIIEIPPLSEKQSGDFLRHLSTEPYANLAFKTIDENMIAHIYRDTHGVPGRIIDEISGLSGAKPRGKLTWILVIAVLAAIAIAFGVQWLASSAPGIAPPPAAIPSPINSDKEVVAPAAVEQKTEPRPDPNIKPTLSPEQPVIQPQEQSSLAPSVLENQDNMAKDTLAPPLVEVHTQDAAKPIPTVPVVKPETTNTIVIKPLPENKAFDGVQQKINEPPASEIKAPIDSVSIAPVEQKPNNRQQSVAAQQKKAKSIGTKQEQAKQPELAKTLNEVTPLISENPAINAPPASVSTAGSDANPDKQQADFVQQNMAERLWAKQEKLKQTNVDKTVGSVEPVASNNPETSPIPQKPVDTTPMAKEPTMGPTAPQQAESSRIDSPVVTTLPPAPAVEGALTPSANNFTLQLIVLSKQSSADDMLKKNPALAPDIRVIKTMIKGKEKLVLEYGSYSDAESANKARQSLPFEFRKALVRKIVR